MRGRRAVASAVVIGAAVSCGRFGFDARTDGAIDVVDAVPCTEADATINYLGSGGARVAGVGDHFVAVWINAPAMYELRSATISATGVVGPQLLLAVRADRLFGGIAGTASEGQAAAWASSSPLRLSAATLDAAGAPQVIIDDVRDAAATGTGFTVPHIVPIAGGFGVVYADQRTSTSMNAYLTRVATSGVKLGADVPLVPGGTAAFLHHAVATEGGFLVAYTTANDVFVGRRSDTGAAVGADAFLGTGPGSGAMPKLARSASEIAVVWQEGNDLRFSRYSHELVPLGPAAVVTSLTTGLLFPSLARSASSWWVSWSADGHTYASELTPEGALTGALVDIPSATGVVGGHVAGNGHAVIFTYADGPTMFFRTSCR